MELKEREEPFCKNLYPMRIGRWEITKEDTDSWAKFVEDTEPFHGTPDQVKNGEAERGLFSISTNIKGDALVIGYAIMPRRVRRIVHGPGTDGPRFA